MLCYFIILLMKFFDGTKDQKDITVELQDWDTFEGVPYKDTGLIMAFAMKLSDPGEPYIEYNDTIKQYIHMKAKWEHYEL